MPNGIVIFRAFLELLQYRNKCHLLLSTSTKIDAQYLYKYEGKFSSLDT